MIGGSEDRRGYRPADVHVESCMAPAIVDFGESGDARRHSAGEETLLPDAIQALSGVDRGYRG
jgi:hypothetical protein